MPEYYLNINAVSRMCSDDIIDTYNHYRKIAKRILKNKKDFDGLPYRDYKCAIERIYPPATKIRSREFLNKYMCRLALFLTIVIWIIWVFYKKRSNPNMMLGFLTYISALAQSFSSGGLFSLLGVLTMMGFLIIYDRNISYSIRKSKLIPVKK